MTEHGSPPKRVRGTPASAAPRDITDFEEVREAWKSPAMSADIPTPGDEYLRGGTVMRLDGQDHLKRRRAMGQLLKRRGHKVFRDTWLFPTTAAALADVRNAPDPDGYARVDLLAWARRVNQQLAAALVGYDRATTPDGAAELFRLLEVVLRGSPPAFVRLRDGYDPEGEAEREALTASRAIVDRFFDSSMERRESLLRDVTAGRLDDDQLPHDLLMLIARRTDPLWADRQLAEREALLLLSAGVHTTSVSMIWTLAELFVWLGDHPDRLGECADEAFLLRVVNEALRLHPVVPGFARMATEEVHLCAGTVVSEGQIGVIRNGPPSVDAGVYGPDAAGFNPDREIPPGVYAFGFAFGTGPHMCYGLPIVMGSEGLDGSLVHLVKSVLAAGVRPDPAAPDPFDGSLAASRGRYVDPPTSYPAIFPAA